MAQLFTAGMLSFLEVFRRLSGSNWLKQHVVEGIQSWGAALSPLPCTVEPPQDLLTRGNKSDKDRAHSSEFPLQTPELLSRSFSYSSTYGQGAWPFSIRLFTVE